MNHSLSQDHTNDSLCLRREYVVSWYQNFSFLFNGILTAIFFVIGIFGNISSIWFLQKSRFGGRKLGTTLSFLAAWDAMLLLFTFGYYGAEAVLSWIIRNPHPTPYPYMNSVFHPLTSISYTASVWFVVAIVIHRYLAVSRPFEHRTFSDNLMTPVCLSIVAAAVQLPSWFELQIASCFDTAHQIMSIQVIPTQLRSFHLYKLLYRVIFANLCLTSLGPMLIILYLTILIILRVKSAAKNRPGMVGRKVSLSCFGRKPSQTSAQERRITFALLFLAGKFLLTHLCPTLIDIWEASGADYTDYIVFFQCLVDISNFLVVFNSATNCLIYLKPNEICRHNKWLSRRFLISHSRKQAMAEQKFISKKIPLFTDQELNTLEETYLTLWSQCSSEGPPMRLGEKIVVNLLKKKPDYCTTLGLSLEFFETQISTKKQIKGWKKVRSMTTVEVGSRPQSGNSTRTSSPNVDTFHKKHKKNTPKVRSTEFTDMVPLEKPVETLPLIPQVTDSPKSISNCGESPVHLKVPQENSTSSSQLSPRFVRKGTTRHVGQLMGNIRMFKTIPMASQKDKLRDQGEKVAEFFWRIITLLRDLTGNPEALLEISEYISGVAKVHKRVGVNFSAGIWKEMKTTIVSTANSRCGEETGKVWAKLVSYAIREMKNQSLDLGMNQVHS